MKNKPLVLKILIPILGIVFLKNCLLSQENLFVKTGGIYGGKVTKIEVGKGDNVFSSTDLNGLFYSSNKGENWEQIWNSGTVLGFALDNNGNIHIGNVNIFKSKNNGVKWEIIDFEKYRASDILIDSKNNLYVPTFESFLYRSSNAGQTWDTILPVYRGEIRKNFLPNSVFLGQNDWLFLPVVRGVIYSSDFGNTWIDPDCKQYLGKINSLITNKMNYFFAGVENAGVFRSVDSGKTWIESNNGLNSLNITSLAINSSGTIFAGTREGGIFVSSNNGLYWKKSNDGLFDKRILALCVSADNMIYAGTQSKGLFRSSDDGVKWSSITSGISDISSPRFIFNNSGNAFAFVNNQDEKKDNAGGFARQNIYRYIPIENKWEEIGLNIPDCVFRTIAINSRDQIFIGTDKGIVNSNDNGQTWNFISQTSGYDIYSISIDKNDNIYIGTYNGGVFISGNDGLNWDKIFQDAAYSKVYSICQNPMGDMFIGMQNSGVFKSSNKGDSWRTMNSGLDYKSVNVLRSDKKGNIYLYGILNNFYLLKNNEETWNKIGIGVLDFTLDEYDNVYILKSRNWIHWSWDMGRNWANLKTTGIEDSLCYTIGLSKDRTMFIGAMGKVYKSLGKISIIKNDEPAPKDYKLYQNYPNPFNPATEIKFTLSHESNVNLKVYDLLGREITTLINEKLEPGMHLKIFDGSNLSSGIYFCKIIISELNKFGNGLSVFSDTKKLVLIK